MSSSPDQITEPAPGLPRLGAPAPPFEAVTTQGVIRLEDYAGNWLVLFSHPADFTPVCTTEILAFAGLQERLRTHHCELLGLSVDSVYSHIAWLRNLEETHGIRVGFPIIADLDRAVATRYGMVMPGESGTEATRCVFVIDDRQAVRAMLYYPLTTGRNTEEILRLVIALQASDACKVATPANWQPGEAVLLPPPVTQDGAEARLQEAEFLCRDWYFCTRELEKV